MRSSKYSVNDSDDLVSRFDAPTCSGDNIMTFLSMRTKLLLRTRMFGSTLIKQFGKAGSLKLLTVTCQRVPKLKN